jgi:cytolysin (calcineurin-like family phosphatase)
MTIFKELKLSRPITLDTDIIRSYGQKIYDVRSKGIAAVDSFTLANHPYIQDILNNFFKFHISPNYTGYVEIDLDKGILHPHTDVHRYALNIILEDQDAVTKFWTTTAQPTSIWGGSTNYNINDCQLISEFKADPGSAWLYDLHTLHSVHGTANIRKLITLRWYGVQDLTFDQLYSSIEVL